MDIINAPPPADSSSQPTSRDASPSGEGLRLGDSSHNGLSSAFTVAGQVRHVGDGGSATTQMPGAYHEEESLGRPTVQVNELEDHVLPGYEDIEQHQGMDLDADEGVDMSYPMHGPLPPWEDNPSWSFALEKGHSQMAACPPGSLDFTNDADEDLFDGAASTKAEGGVGSSTGNLSDADERMKDFADLESSAPLGPRGMRESAPPPLIEGEDEEELPVVELHIPDSDMTAN